MANHARSIAEQESQKLNIYQNLTYYGFLTPKQAEHLYQQFKKAGAVIPVDRWRIFPAHLDAAYVPSLTWEEACHYIEARVACADWPFYDRRAAKNPKSYWGLDRVIELKEAFERYSGVGNFSGLLFNFSTGIDGLPIKIFPMRGGVYRLAQRAVAEWCWHYRLIWISCLQHGLIQDEAWLTQLLLNSAILLNPKVSPEILKEKILQLEKDWAPDLSLLQQIQFLEITRQRNETIFDQMAKQRIFFKQYRHFVSENKQFLQEKVSLENYFDRSSLRK